MTIDPDDYDLRELRRIADERRGARRTADEPGADRRPDGTDDSHADGRRSTDRRAGDGRAGNTRADGDRRPPRAASEGRRRGRSTRRRTGDREDDDAARDDHSGSNDRMRNGRADERERSGRADGHARSSESDRRGDDADRATVRPRDEISRPRRGDSDHARAHDEVFRADRIARDLGFGAADRARSNGGSRSELGGTTRSRPPESAYEDAPRRNGGHSRQDRRRARREPTDSVDDVGRFQFDTDIRERPRGRAGEALRQNQLEQLLVRETAAAGDGLSKPYLAALPDEYAAERIVFDWLEFLVLKGGFKRTMDALRYYHTVEWLTEGVEAELQDYLVGFSGEVSNTSEFDVDDHHLSLVYIAQLASMA
ncbi:FlaD/FlaE family flagellar protein [Halobellus sp. GM3]|uniref:FlaD/FlaE family flagellar protein n=1 Tax=Halobellus sp. GM3 TaxID=3458410 RepID=UPI00403DBF69